MRPGTIKDGYLLFEDVPLDINGDIRLDVGSAYWESKDNFVYTSKLYVFNFKYP